MPDFYSVIRMLGNKITSLGTPTVGTDAATKQYVDDHIADGDDAHDAAAVSFDPTALAVVVATNVQDAIEELDADSVLQDQELDDHIVDPTDAHDAAAVSLDPTGLQIVVAGNVQDAIEELDAGLDAHEVDTSDAHDAASISVNPAGTLAATNAQGALEELASEAAIDQQNLADHIADAVAAHDASAISVTPVGDISATDVQAALAELSSEKATVQFVSDSIAGLSWKQTARSATTADITLSGEQTIDGVAVVAGDRVLVKDQTLSEQNGIYVAAVGAWTRSTDANTAAEILQAAVLIEEGTVNADKGFSLQTNAPLVLNTTPLTFVPFGYSGTPTGPAGGVLAGTYPNPSFAVDMATQAELDAHVTETVDAHDGAAISFDPTGTALTAIEVQGAIEELDQDLTDHIADPTDAHDASAISSVAAGNLVSTNVQDALDELDAEKAPEIHDHTTADGTGPLTDDEHDGFSDYAASAVPSNPAADHIRRSVQALSTGGGSTAPFGLEKTPTGGQYTDGQDTWFMGWNSSGSVIKDKGRAVYLSSAGADGIGAFGLGDARFSNSLAYGILAENVAPLAMGRALVKGLLLNIDTTAFSVGPLYLSTSANAGILTSTPPSGQTDYTQRVGTVLRTHATQGVIWVDIQYFGVSHNHSGTAEGGDDLFPRVIGPNSFTTAAEVGGANRNNWDPGGSFQSNPTTVVLLTSATLAFNLTGIVAPAFVSSIWVHFFNLTSVNVTINNQSGNSSATNRIITPNGLDWIVKPNESLWMLYVSSGGLNRWVISDQIPKFSETIGPAQLTADTHNWNPTDLATALVIRLSTDATRTLTGIVGGAESRHLVLQNAGSFNLILPHNHASSIAGNRFITPNGEDFYLGSNDSVLIVYDNIQAFWRVVGRRKIHTHGSNEQGGGALTPTSIVNSGSTSTVGLVNSGALSETGIIQPSVSGTLNDWNPAGLATARTIWVTCTGHTTITGIDATGVPVGRRLLIYNPTSFNVTIPHENAGSSGNNRFFGGIQAAGLLLRTNEEMDFIYLGNRWLPANNYVYQHDHLNHANRQRHEWLGPGNYHPDPASVNPQTRANVGNSADGWHWTAADEMFGQINWRIPADYVDATAIIFKYYWTKGADGTGNVGFYSYGNVASSGDGISNGGTWSIATFVAVPANGPPPKLKIDTIHTITPAAGAFLPGDMVSILAGRAGSNGSDTYAGHIVWHGVLIEYTADQ